MMSLKSVSCKADNYKYDNVLWHYKEVTYRTSAA